MNDLKELVIQLTVFSVVISLMTLLIPKGNLKKQIKSLFGIVFLIIILRGLSSLKKPEIDLNANKVEIDSSFSTTISEQVELQNNKKMSQIGNKLLKDNKVSAEVAFSTDISVDNVISINARVISDDKNECERAAVLIIQEFGIEPEMVVTE